MSTKNTIFSQKKTEKLIGDAIVPKNLFSVSIIARRMLSQRIQLRFAAFYQALQALMKSHITLYTVSTTRALSLTELKAVIPCA